MNPYLFRLLKRSIIGTFVASASCGALAQSSTTGGDPDDGPPDRVAWTPDRRPVRVLTIHNGSETNPRGLSIGLYVRDDDGPPANQTEYDAVLAQTLQFIDSGYDDGWRRFMLNLPAGTYRNCGVFSGNQWTALPAWKQQLYEDVYDWIDDGHEDATIGVYSGGFCCTTLASLCTAASAGCAGGYCTDPNLTFTPYAASGIGLTALTANAGGYQEIGCYEYFIDTAATDPEEMFYIFTHPNFYNVIRMGGEAIPLKVVNGVTRADPDPPYGVARTQRFIDMLKRIYGFGVITGGADFNMDGAVNQADYDSFMTAFFAHANQQGNHVHGDFNGDTLISPDDLSDFINAYFGYDPGFDFAGPNPEYATVP
jgi:hypothetical protein